MTTRTRKESYCDFCGEDRAIDGILDLSSNHRFTFCDPGIRLELCDDCYHSMVEALKKKRDEARERHGDY